VVRRQDGGQTGGDLPQRLDHRRRGGPGRRMRRHHGRQQRAERPRRHRQRLGQRRPDPLGGGAAEGRRARHREIERRAERPHVAGRPAGLALQPLGRDEPGRADHQALLGQRRLALLPGDAEVGEHHPAAVGEEDVARLHVTVLKATGVRGRQRVEHVGADPGGVLHRHRAVRLHRLAEGAAAQQLHDDPGPVVLHDDVMQRHDARVAQLGHRLGLAHGPGDQLGPLLGGQPLGQGELLDRHLAVKHLVPGQPDPPHATAAQRLHQGVAVGESSPGHKGKGNEGSSRIVIRPGRATVGRPVYGLGSWNRYKAPSTSSALR
jgi:hypothetical protein